MADHYTQTSFMIPTKTDEQKAWLLDVLGQLDEVQAETMEPSDINDEIIAVATEHHYNFDGMYTPYYCSEKEGVWIRSDESIDVDLMIVVIQAYLRKFHPNSFMGFQWAGTCSKPRLDEFGGGAVYISADDFEAYTTGGWLWDQFKDASAGGGEQLE